ncbi:pentatricopeptide repeat-containing protein At2g35030, mitochondrial-like [Selaginella moellendorffii]|uniref:pentatricopeptide repeat-containing protein At2g35030, mitochondrial-like n=1 Tax=Selaginella moellendorffii TaxID=88036 RepID=UPI000D1CC69A|nr:pentatricopeptide repeat-containing protein At2g35030, mitochondrial-like [Selaginella moellendorffii]|eukprot:XP_024539382.1 pentatricopeptide repeat-containing protein At2g35030, mitochondrial-like [Selaginella moellendorffii]
MAILILSSCPSNRTATRRTWARKVHARIERNRDLKESLHLWNLVIETYGKCGSVEEARAVFDRISDRNLVSWNILLAAYARNGDIAQRWKCLERCHHRISSRGQPWLPHLPRRGICVERQSSSMPHKNMIAWNAMITGHEKAGLMEEEKKLFDCMPLKDVVSWNAMVAGYAGNGKLDLAREVFESMILRDSVSWTTMIRIYVAGGEIGEARALFERMPMETAILQGHTENGDLEEARVLFEKIQCPDATCIAPWT